MNAYDVTVYVSVPVTLRGVRAATPTHAAMDAATALAELLDADRMVLLGYDDQPLETLDVGGLKCEVSDEADSGDIDGFLVQEPGAAEGVTLDSNGNQIP